VTLGPFVDGQRGIHVEKRDTLHSTIHSTIHVDATYLVQRCTYVEITLRPDGEHGFYIDKLRGIRVEKPDVCDSTVNSTVHVDSTQSVHVESTWKLRYSLMGSIWVSVIQL